MRDWITDAQSLRGVDEAMIADSLAALHARFEQIHPFLDGNGRTGRLVLNLLLVRLGIPPAIIYKGDRSRYLAALRRADNGDHVTARRVPRTSRARQPLHVHRPGRRRTRAARSAPGTRNRAALRERPTRGGDPRPPEGRQGSRRHLAKLEGVGRRVPRHPLQTLMTTLLAGTSRRVPRPSLARPSRAKAPREHHPRVRPDRLLRHLAMPETLLVGGLRGQLGDTTPSKRDQTRGKHDSSLRCRSAPFAGTKPPRPSN
jgi:hypothetical protein